MSTFIWWCNCGCGNLPFTNYCTLCDKPRPCLVDFDVTISTTNNPTLSVQPYTIQQRSKEKERPAKFLPLNRERTNNTGRTPFPAED